MTTRLTAIEVAMLLRLAAKKRNLVGRPTEERVMEATGSIQMSQEKWLEGRYALGTLPKIFDELLRLTVENRNLEAELESCQRELDAWRTFGDDRAH